MTQRRIKTGLVHTLHAETDQDSVRLYLVQRSDGRHYGYDIKLSREEWGEFSAWVEYQHAVHTMLESHLRDGAG